MSYHLNISQKTLSDLEWNSVFSAWVELCDTEMGKSKLSSLEFCKTIESANERSSIISEIRTFNLEGVVFNLKSLVSLLDIIKRIDIGGTIKSSSLYNIIIQLSIASEIKKQVSSSPDGVTASILNDLNPLFWLRTTLEESIDEKGEIKSSASSELFGLRARKTAVQKDLVKILNNIINSTEIAPYLQDTFHTEREQRFVIPVKSEFRSNIKGIIHTTSNSGQTVFMEPQEVIDLNNRLKEIDSDIEIEEYKILSRLAQAVSEVTDILRNNEKLLATLDFYNAAAKFSKQLDGIPLNFNTINKIDLYSIKHPILIMHNIDVVSNDVKLDKGKVLVITGPNGGGKTVAIKTVGLIFLMAKMGLHVPCGRNSSMPFFNNVLTMIGDEQNISSHLSTFSAQIENMKNVVKNSKNNDLVVLDELAVGTDPAQGSVLAQAVLENLAKSGVTTLVTTHFSRLKALALIEENFVNASVGGKTAEPDFKLVTGMAGTSEGIMVASRLGLDPLIVKRAKTLFGEGDNKIDQLLGELSKRNKDAKELQLRLETEQKQIEKEKQRVLILKNQQEDELKRLKKERLENTMDEIRKIKQFLHRIKKEIEKETLSKNRINELTDAVVKVQKTVSDAYEPYLPEPVKFKNIKVGQHLFSRSLGINVEIIKIDNPEKILVSVGNFTATLVVEDLFLNSNESSKENSKENSKESSIARSNRKSDREKNAALKSEKPGELSVSDRLEKVIITPSNTLDLRGKRVEPALVEMNSFLDKMALANFDGCAVIHGYGSGALKKAVREELSKSPYVINYRGGDRGEGGDGVTIILIV